MATQAKETFKTDVSIVSLGIMPGTFTVSAQGYEWTTDLEEIYGALAPWKDIRRGTHWGDAGILLRVTDPAFGVDAYDGYYLGIGFDENSLILGRVNHAWERVRVVPLNFPVRTSNWYRLRATVQGCYIDATVQETGTKALARLIYFDEHCTKLVGTVSVRVYSLQASWRHFAVNSE